MPRWLSLLALTASLGGCIIYETEGGWGDDSWCTGAMCDDDRRDRCGDGDDDSGLICTTDPTGTATGTGTGTGTATTPAPLPEFSFVPDEACIGDAVLTWLVADDPTWDYTNIDGVLFVGDVVVTDTIVRTDEVILLLDIPANADPGVVQGLVELTDGQATLADGGITLVECGGGAGTGTGTGTGAGTGTGTGAGTGTGTGAGTGTGTGGGCVCPADTGTPPEEPPCPC